VSKAPQPSGLALADLNGDGYFDIVEANYLDPGDIQVDFGLDQNYYLLDHNGYGRPSRIFTAPYGARSVHVGHIYNDSEFPDLAFGDCDSNVILSANLGNHHPNNINNNNTGVVDIIFRGFEQRDVFQVSDAFCQVRGIKIASLSPCSVSILAAVTCLNGKVLDEGQNSSRAIHRIDPTGQSCLPPPSSSSPSSQVTPPPLSYPVENPPSPLGGESGSAAVASSAAPPRVLVNALLRYQLALIEGVLAVTLLFAVWH
jgi:hypothetical protein